MLQLLTVSLFAFGANALLFPLNNGMEPEPELLFACPPPRAPQFGTLSCEYHMFDMNCAATCNNGFQFESGMNTYTHSCNMFEGGNTYDAPKCVRIGGVVQPTLEPVTVRPSSYAGCINSLDDCFNKLPGDYAYCANCRQYATCAPSGFYVRNCPEISVFDAARDACVGYSSTACKYIP